jgi:hypothetical protein
MDWKSGEFELESFRFVDLFLTSSKFENIGFLESGIKSDRILCIGDPLIYDLLNTRRINRPGVTVTWAPHWTKNFYDQEGWSNWFLQIREILDFAIRFPTIRHIFRPHPLFFLNGFEWNEKLPDYAKEMWAVGFENEIELLHKYLSLPNVILSNSDLKTDLLQTDILITDGISILGYGLASGCIVGLSRRSSSPKLGEAGVEFLPFCHLINVENSETYDFLTLSISKAEINDSEPQKVFISQMYLIDNEPPGLRFVDSLKLS